MSTLTRPQPVLTESIDKPRASHVLLGTVTVPDQSGISTNSLPKVIKAGLDPKVVVNGCVVVYYHPEGVMVRLNVYSAKPAAPQSENAPVQQTFVASEIVLPSGQSHTITYRLVHVDSFVCVVADVEPPV